MYDQNLHLITVPVELSDGTIVLAEAIIADYEEEVSLKDYKLSEVITSIKTIVADLINPLSKFSCDKIALEVGFGLTLKEGKLTSILIGGSANSSIKLTLEWKNKENKGG